MQTSGFLGVDTSEREAELRRRNEEIELRQAEAVRIARDIIQSQEAKLATSPSPSRAAGAGEQRPQATTAKSPTRKEGFFGCEAKNKNANIHY